MEQLSQTAQMHYTQPDYQWRLESNVEAQLDVKEKFAKFKTKIFFVGVLTLGRLAPNQLLSRFGVPISWHLCLNLEIFRETSTRNGSELIKSCKLLIEQVLFLSEA